MVALGYSLLGELQGYSSLGELQGYFPLGKFVLWLLPTEEVGFMVTSHWGSWFYGYFPLEKLVL